MSEKIRLFFALWPDQVTRQSIVKKTKPLLVDIPNKITPANFHVTLAFIGYVEKSQLSCYRQAADAVCAERFVLRLNTTGFFPQAKMFWLGCKSVNPELKHLVSKLNDELGFCDYTADQRPYTPHVSLARKYNQSSLFEFNDEIEWQVNSFSLIESRSTNGGVEYHELYSWLLD